jgi:hypothetical protein
MLLFYGFLKTFSILGQIGKVQPNPGHYALVASVFAFMVSELVGGILSNSLALLGDAGHMLTDIMSLALSLFALYLALRPPSSTKPMGFIGWKSWRPETHRRFSPGVYPYTPRAAAATNLPGRFILTVEKERQASSWFRPCVG